MTKASSDGAGLANQIAVPGAQGGTALGAGSPNLELFCGDFDMRIGRDGTWYYRGSPIGRAALVKLFASVLKRDESGVYWLATPVERGRIAVDDAPFTAVEVTSDGTGRDQTLRFRTNLDETVAAGPDRPIRVVHDPATGEPSPYILVRPGGADGLGLEALILRPVYYQLVELAVEERQGDDDLFGVWSRGRFFPLGRLEGK